MLAAILLVVILNLVSSLGVFSGSGYEYKSLDSQQMDSLGFRAIAEEEGIPMSEDGEITFPKELVNKISKTNLLPRTIQEVEKDGGWEFVGVTSDSYFLFRKRR